MTPVLGDSPDSATLLLFGGLPLALFGGALIAAPLSFLLLWRYRRAVLRGMMQSASNLAPRRPASAAHAEAGALAIRTVDSRSTTSSPAARAGARRARVAVRRSTAIYAGAGAVFAAVLVAPLLIRYDQQLVDSIPRIGGWRWISVLWIDCWPAVIAVTLCMANGRGAQWRVVGIYAAILGGVLTLALAPDPRWIGVAALMLLVAVLPSVVTYAFLARRVRAVGPLVFTFVAVLLLGLLLGGTFLSQADVASRIALRVQASIGLDPSELLVGLFALMALGLVACSFVLFKGLAARYAAKRLSDQSLLIDSMFLLSGVMLSYQLVFVYFRIGWIVAGVTAFLAYLVARSIGFRLSFPTAPPRTLLLLRVFALGNRSGRLFDALRRRWLHCGAIAMIAGPDLATSAVEPHEFLQFVSGSLSREFIADDADLDRRARAMDRRRDPDGRFRVTEFFCHANTWQATVQRLAAETDVVLMDLRSFSPARAGCIYELGVLIGSIPLDRVLLLVDDTTDRPFLESTVQDLWARFGSASPGGQPPAPALQMLATGGSANRDVDVLFEMLLASG